MRMIGSVLRHTYSSGFPVLKRGVLALKLDFIREILTALFS